MMGIDFRTNLPQILAVCIKNIILVAFGMTLGFPTVLIPALQAQPGEESTSDLILNKTQISWISSINLICVPLGCIFSGSFTAFLGRRRAMQLMCLPLFSSWIIFFFAQQVSHLYIALCMSGFTGGMLEAPVLTYVAEITTPKLRGILAATGSFCIILGIFSQFLMGLFLDWRQITLWSTSAPLIAVFFLFFVPESPHWLILKSKNEEAKKSLMWLRGWHKTFDPVKQEYDELYTSITTRDDSAVDGSNGSTLSAFRKRTFLLPYFICSLAFLIGHFSGMTTLQTFAVPIFAQLKAPIDKYFATMLLGIVELIGTAICVMLVRFVGKRKLTFFSLLGCSFCFFSTSIYAYFIDRIPGEIPKDNIFANITQQIENVNASTTELIDSIMTTITTESGLATTKEYVSELQASSLIDENANASSIIDLQSHSWIPLTLLLASALLSHSGIRLLPWMLIGEVFPARIRGVSSGLTGGTSYIFGFLANKLFLTMVGGLTLPGTFLLNSCVSAVGCLLLYFLLPETEGRTLREIEDHFSGKQKLSFTLKRKDLIPDEPFPAKFDVTHWESNEKFEKSLQQHNVVHPPLFPNGVKEAKRKYPANENHEGKPRVVVNDADYDTSL